jgi:predicted PurR-regulated permease PerM
VTSPAIQQANDKFHDVDQKINDFFNKVSDVLSWVPGFLSDLIKPIEDGLNALRQKVKEFWDRVNQLINQPGSPTRLHQVAEDWVNKVGNVVGDIAGRISLDKLQTNLDWEGRGAEAYKATVPAQVSGLNSVKDLANQLRSSLDNLGNGIETFWTAMAVAAGVFVVGAIAAIATACTVVGIPAAIAAIATAAGVSIGLITTAILSLQALTNTISTEQNTIAQKVHDLGDKWAKSNTGAMQDKSDWHVMQ